MTFGLRMLSPSWPSACISSSLHLSPTMRISGYVCQPTLNHAFTTTTLHSIARHNKDHMTAGWQVPLHERRTILFLLSCTRMHCWEPSDIHPRPSTHPVSWILFVLLRLVGPFSPCGASSTRVINKTRAPSLRRSRSGYIRMSCRMSWRTAK